MPGQWRMCVQRWYQIWVCMCIRGFTKFGIKVLRRLQFFIGYRTLNLNFQKARTKIASGNKAGQLTWYHQEFLSEKSRQPQNSLGILVSSLLSWTQRHHPITKPLHRNSNIKADSITCCHHDYWPRVHKTTNKDHHLVGHACYPTRLIGMQKLSLQNQDPKSF